MSDSTAALLFEIKADSEDAQANIKRLRSIMGKDLDELSNEFDTWSKKVLGSITSVQGAVVAGGAAMGAAIVAVGAFAVESAEKYMHYASEIGKGSKLTGIAAEDMSKLRFAAEAVGVNYESLITGLTRFATTTVKAAEGSEQQLAAFRRLGLGQRDAQEGEKNLLPLIYKVMDAFHGATSSVQKTAEARELFSRGGAGMLSFLNMGSAGLKQFAAEAERLGYVISQKDVIAAKEFKMALHELQAQKEALDLSIGQKTLPLLTWWREAQIGVIEAIKNWKPGKIGIPFFLAATVEADKAAEHVQKMMKAAQGHGDTLMPPPDEKVKEMKADFTGVSSVLEQIRQKTDSTGDGFAKINSEVLHFQFELDKAERELVKLRAEGKLTPETLRREMDALAKTPAALRGYNLGAQKELRDKQSQEILAAGEDLRQKLNAQQDKGWQEQLAAWDGEIQKLREHLTKKETLTEGNQKLLEELAEAGREKIERGRQESYTQELVQMQHEMASVIGASMTTAECLQFIYEQDLERYNAVEEAKRQKVAKEGPERLALEQQFALNRKSLLDKYNQDLMVLQNSQGWRGVLGGGFGQMLRGDEAAWKHWSESANQAMLMTRLSATALNQDFQRAFGQFSQGMGQGIADAIVYSKSIGEAMRAATASTLESLAARAFAQAIDATALGFLRLAQYDYGSASSAFQAAALFGSIGLAEAVAGRAIAPSQSANAGSSSGSGTSASSSSASASSASGGAAGPRVVINVQGSVYGISGVDELAQMLNDAVANRDVRLIATQVKQTTRVTN